MRYSRPLIALIAAALVGSAACASGSTDDPQRQLAAAQAEVAQLRAQLQQASTTAPAAPAAAVAPAAGAPTGATAATPTENVVYALGPGRVSIVEPRSARVVKEITGGLERAEWADAVVSPDNRLLFANDRPNAQVVVIDTGKQEIVKRIEVGARPVHIFNPNHGNEIWTHSDEEGAFYVIDVNTLEVTAVVVAALKGTGHGKLIYHPTLGNKAYATNVMDPEVFVIDLATKQVTGTIPVCEGRGGTHAKTYSEVSRYAYFECTATGMTAVVDTATDGVVTHLEGSGYLQTSPDGKTVVILDKRNNRVLVVDAARGAEIAGSIPVPGGADSVGFFEKGGKLYAFTANTQAPDSALVDFTDMKLVKRVAAGDIERPAGAESLHRSSDVGGGYYYTPASADGVLAIIDLDRQSLHAAVPVPGASGMAFVGPRH